MGKASLVLGVSERQCYRIKARVKQYGVKGVVHANRGRPCKRKLKEKEVKRIVELAKGKYRGFNDHHLTEKLREQEEIELSREKIRRVLRSHGILSPRKKRTAKHRSRRERKEAEGIMLQVDGSPHDWLEGRGPSLCLIGAIDDATGKVVGALFVEAESTWGYFRLFSEIFNKHGLPQSVYADRHSIFWTDREPTIEEQLKNQRPTTEVGRGLQELGVTLIPSQAPLRPRAESRDCGELSRTVWSVNSEERELKLKPRRKSCSRVISPSITGNSPSLPPKQNPPGEKPAPPGSKEPCALNKSAPSLRTTPLPLKARSFKSLSNLPIAPTPTSESMCMCCWTVQWSFSTKTKKSPASTPKQRTELAYIERSASGKGSAMVLFPRFKPRKQGC